MNQRSRICLYTIALSYILLQLIRLWIEYFDPSMGGIPSYFALPLVPVGLGLVSCLLGEKKE